MSTFFGRGPGPQIARMDMQAATAPGRNFGSMFANLGEQAGNALKTFYDNKEKSDNADMQIGALLEGLSPERRKEVDSGEGDIGKALIAMQKGELGLAKKQGLIGALAIMQKQEVDKEARDRLQKQDAMRLELFLNQQDDRQRNEDFAKGMFAQPKRAITQADVDAGFEVPPLDPDPFAPPPQISAGDSPAVQALPERYRSYGQEIAKKVQSGEIDPRMGLQEIQRANKEARANAIDPLQFAKFQLEAKTFSQDQGFKTFTPENNSIQVGDEVLPVSGTIGSAKVAEELKGEFIPNFNAMNGMFQELVALGEKDGFWDDAIDKAKADALVKSIQGLMREDILGPGTVQESERVILDNIVKNPFTKMDSLSADESIKLLRGLQTRISDKFKNKLTSFGLQVGSGSSAQPSTPSLTTSSGKTVKLFNLDEL